MITIGVTFCDNDYQYYDRLMAQIEENVKLPHEVIVIDNTEGNKLRDKATYAFGHNTYCFSARYKIIKLAKGDFIWFVDGDDEVVNLDYVSDSDIIVFNYSPISPINYQHDNKIYKDDIHSLEFMTDVTGTQLWNKLIKTELFKDIDKYLDNPLVDIVSMEDTYYVCFALRNASVIETRSEITYHHNPGLSTSNNVTNEQFDLLITGWKEVRELIAKLGINVERFQYDYYMTFIPGAEDPNYILSKIIDMGCTDKDYWFDKYLQLYLKSEDVKQLYLDKFGEVPKNKMIIRYPDGREEVRYEDYRVSGNNIYKHKDNLKLIGD